MINFQQYLRRSWVVCQCAKIQACGRSFLGRKRCFEAEYFFQWDGACMAWNFG